MKGISRPFGPPFVDPRRKQYAEKFGVSSDVAAHMTIKLLNQLDACASDMHRRIILGVKEKGA